MTERAPGYENDVARRLAEVEGKLLATVQLRGALFQSIHDEIDALALRLDERMDGQTKAVEVAAREREKAAETLRDEQHHALDTASREREKAAETLRDEQHRALDTASRERDKAAEALAVALQQSIKDGEDRLRDHIENQIHQIRSALDAAERLQVARLAKATGETEALADKLQQRFDSTQEAVSKAEIATEKRFESVNEFRGQLSDQVREFLPREVADTQLNELRKALADATRRLDILSGKSTGASATYTAFIAGIGLFVTVVVLLANHTFG